MNFSLLFKKCNTAREYVDKSKLEKVLNAAVVILLLFSIFFLVSPLIAFMHFAGPFVFRALSIFFTFLAVGVFTLRWVYKHSLDEQFLEFREELEGELYSEYEPFYFKRARDYIDVNAHFGTDNNQTKIIVGYQRNSYFSIVTAVIAVIIAAVFLLFGLNEMRFPPILPYGMTLPLAIIFASLAIFYIYYVIRRFEKFNRYYIGVTVSSLRDDSYEEKLDGNFLYIMQNSAKLSKRAQTECERHANGWVSGLFATWQDAILFGVLIAGFFFYLIAIWYFIKIIIKICAENLNIGTGGSSSYDNDGMGDTDSSTRLVLTGHGWNDYYEIDGKDITHYGSCTDYELHGREIWYVGGDRVRTVGFIETNGSVGSVMYASDWDGERIFERYEHK